jgi:hypothetical protein
MKQIALIMVSLFFVVSMPIVGAVGDLSSHIDVFAQAAYDSPPPADEYGGDDIVEPPPVQFAEPPDVVVVPSGTSYVYMVPDTPGFYFYHGNWYRYYEGYWFRSRAYNGPWGFVEASFVPRVVVSVPPEYILFLPFGYHRIHYGDLHRSWRSWDQGRYWNRHDWFKHELRDDIRRDRLSHIRAEREKSRHAEDRRNKHFDSHDGRGSGHAVTDGGRKDGSAFNKRAATMGKGGGDKAVTGGGRKGGSDINKRAATMGKGGGDKTVTEGGRKDGSAVNKGNRSGTEDRLKGGNTNIEKSHHQQGEKDSKKDK